MKSERGYFALRLGFVCGEQKEAREPRDVVTTLL